MRAYETAKITIYDYLRGGSKRLIPYTSTTDALKYISISITFLTHGCNHKRLIIFVVEKIYNKMNEIFNKIPMTMPVKTYQYFKEKWQLLL